MSKPALAPLFSMAATATLFLLLRRTLAPLEAPLGWLIPGAFISFEPKIDPRFVLSLLSGIATLTAGCLCLLAHLALWARQRFASLVSSVARE